MSIKQIINNERWNADVFEPIGYHILAPAHNASLDRIEAEVKKRVTEMLWESNTLTVDACKHRIAEIEAQIPKPVERKSGVCMGCGYMLLSIDNYCACCGGKINGGES